MTDVNNTRFENVDLTFIQGYSSELLRQALDFNQEDNLCAVIEKEALPDFSEYERIVLAISEKTLKTIRKFSQAMHESEGIDGIIPYGFFSVSVDMNAFNPGSLYATDYSRDEGFQEKDVCLKSFSEFYTEYEDASNHDFVTSENKIIISSEGITLSCANKQGYEIKRKIFREEMDAILDAFNKPASSPGM